ncbi:MAG: hypothetical protein Q6351_006660 [Candidatus Njordarchaeum guaymaensis]
MKAYIKYLEDALKKGSGSSLDILAAFIVAWAHFDQQNPLSFRIRRMVKLTPTRDFKFAFNEALSSMRVNSKVKDRAIEAVFAAISAEFVRKALVDAAWQSVATSLLSAANELLQMKPASTHVKLLISELQNVISVTEEKTREKGPPPMGGEITPGEIPRQPTPQPATTGISTVQQTPVQQPAQPIQAPPQAAPTQQEGIGIPPDQLKQITDKLLEIDNKIINVLNMSSEINNLKEATRGILKTLTEFIRRFSEFSEQLNGSIAVIKALVTRIDKKEAEKEQPLEIDLSQLKDAIEKIIEEKLSHLEKLLLASKPMEEKAEVIEQKEEIEKEIKPEIREEISESRPETIVEPPIEAITEEPTPEEVIVSEAEVKPERAPKEVESLGPPAEAMTERSLEGTKEGTKISELEEFEEEKLSEAIELPELPEIIAEEEQTKTVLIGVIGKLSTLRGILAEYEDPDEKYRWVLRNITGVGKKIILEGIYKGKSETRLIEIIDNSIGMIILPPSTEEENFIEKAKNTLRLMKNLKFIIIGTKTSPADIVSRALTGELKIINKIINTKEDLIEALRNFSDLM